MRALARNMTLSAVLLALFAVVGTGLVALTFDATKERIAENERAALLRSLHALVPPSMHDNDIFADTIEVVAPEYLGTHRPQTVYRARRGGQPVAAVITSTAPDGYSGNIWLLVAIRYDGTLLGARVLSHRETPGLGDAIEETRSDWIHSFAGKSLADPGPRGWNVRRDGGVFDQFTGATITPRAVVKAVHRTLLYFRDQRAALFAPAPGTPSAEGTT